MCVALPGKVIEIKDRDAVVDFNGNQVTARAGLVDVRVGDYVLVHAGCVIQKVTQQDMEDAVKAFPSLTVLKGMEMDVDETLPEEYYKRELKEYFDLDYMCTGVHFVQKPDGSYIHIGVNLHYDMDKQYQYS